MDSDRDGTYTDSEEMERGRLVDIVSMLLIRQGYTAARRRLSPGFSANALVEQEDLVWHFVGLTPW